MLIAVPNISEGRDREWLRGVVEELKKTVHVLDVHSDTAHNRSVLTLAGENDALVGAIEALARACRTIDMERHEGVHPALGGLDVAPFVTGDDPEAAIAAAHRAAVAIGAAGIPVYLYGAAARRSQTRDLPDLRRGGLSGLMARALTDLAPDEGPSAIDIHTGVVCIGARGPLIAFNVWLDGAPEVARAIARSVRVPGVVRALGLDIGAGQIQVSMNLIAPHEIGIDEAFRRVEGLADAHGVSIAATELVGLVPRRFLPAPDAQAARLLLEPGRCLEAALSD